MDKPTLKELINELNHKRLVIGGIRNEINGHHGAYPPTEAELFNKRYQYRMQIDRINTLTKECHAIADEIVIRKRNGERE